MPGNPLSASRKNERVSIMKYCEFYINDKSCLECPYRDGYQPCLNNIPTFGEKITIRTSKKTGKFIRDFANYAGCNVSDVVNALIEHGVKSLKKNVYQEIHESDSEWDIDKFSKIKKELNQL